MARPVCWLLLLGALASGCRGELTPDETLPDAEALLARSIAYHDPGGVWETASIRLEIVESRPEGEDRRTVLSMNPARGIVTAAQESESRATAFTVEGEEITHREAGGRADLDEAGLAEHGLGAERVMRLRNYYLFLWGLPMKLRDPGTIVDPIVVPESYDGQPALRVRVTYEAEVGGDTWYFYFDPETARLIGYRFYHDETANDGEYIHLAGEIEDGGLRLPAARRWFFHQGDEFLGEDTAVALTVTP